MESRVESILGKMTLEEKIDLLGGVDFFYLRGVPRLGVPRLRMADGPFGVRNDGPATAFASGIGLAATWNPALAERVGVEFGRDARAKGVHFLLAPGVNIYRAPITGRNFEYFGEDPFLAGRTAVGFIKGVQSQGVSATVKHFVANNAEYDRNHTDSIVDERTLREIYLPAFEAAVKEAQVGAIMDAYNLTNGVYMSQNGYLNNDVAKKEWGFSGRHDVGLDLDLRRHGRGERRPRRRDAFGRAPEPREPAAGDPGGQGQRGDDRRQGAPHPAHGGPLRLARSRRGRPRRSRATTGRAGRWRWQNAREAMVLLKNEGAPAAVRPAA